MSNPNTNNTQPSNTEPLDEEMLEWKRWAEKCIAEENELRNETQDLNAK